MILSKPICKDYGEPTGLDPLPKRPGITSKKCCICFLKGGVEKLQQFITVNSASH
jgi:hypothetical protein